MSSVMTSLHFVTVFVTLFFNLFKRRVWIRHGTSDKQFLLIGGFAEPVEMWSWMLKEVIGQDDTVIVMERRFTEKGRWGWWPIGWTPLWFQRWEVRSIFHQLKTMGIVHRGVTVIGHSLGGLLAADLALAFPQTVGDTHIIAFPDKWGTLFHGKFWKGLGLPGLGRALLGTILPFIGMEVPPSTVRGLFTRPFTKVEEVYGFHRQLVIDSPIVFYALVFWYGLLGRNRILRAQDKGWLGRVTYYICPEDAIFRARDIVSVYQRTDGHLVELAAGTPHCFWFAEGTSIGENARRLRAAIYKPNVTVPLFRHSEPQTCTGDRISGE